MDSDISFRKYQLKNGQELIVRNPVIEDAEALIHQMKVVDAETQFLAREPDEFNMTVEQEKEFIERSANNDDIQFLIGTIDDEIIANCSVGRIQNKKRFRHRAALGIVVRKDFWGRGIGRIMMQECIDWCRSQNVEQLELEVVTKNKRAVAMYESLGFQIQGTTKNAMKYDDGSYADEYAMILFIDEN